MERFSFLGLRLREVVGLFVAGAEGALCLFRVDRRAAGVLGGSDAVVGVVVVVSGVVVVWIVVVTGVALGAVVLGGRGLTADRRLWAEAVDRPN